MDILKYATGETVELFDQVRLDVADHCPQGTITAIRAVSNRLRVGYCHPVSGLWLSTWFDIHDVRFDGRHDDAA